MAQPTNTKHIPSPNISGGANDINLPENSKVAGSNSNIYLKEPSLKWFLYSRSIKTRNF